VIGLVWSGLVATLRSDQTTRLRHNRLDRQYTQLGNQDAKKCGL
jgi:hypothetical protein